MKRIELKAIWKNEEKIAHIHGWDFSHIHGRYEEQTDLPWDYEKIIKRKPIAQLSFMMLVRSCGLHILLNGNFQNFQLMDALNI